MVTVPGKNAIPAQDALQVQQVKIPLIRQTYPAKTDHPFTI
jgi:hypothetical protein